MHSPAWRFVALEIYTFPQSPPGFAGWKELVRFLAAELERESLLIEPVERTLASPTAVESDNKGIG